MAKARREYAQVVAESRRRLARVAGGPKLSAAKSVYDKAQNTLVQRLKKLPQGPIFTRHHYELLLAQIRAGQIDMVRRLSPTLDKLSLEAQEEALDGLLQDMGRMAGRFGKHLPLARVEEALNFDAVINPIRPSLLKVQQRSLARYGASLVNKMQDTMGQGMIDGASQDEVVKRIANVAGVEWWQGERIVRTEMSYALNNTANAGLEEINAEVPGLRLYKRWSEHCDADGNPLDDRVADDSLVMEGQVTSPQGLFTMPQDPKAPQRLVGLSWHAPPNRPNDRAALTPWSIDMGGLAYECVNLQKRWLSRP